ncbi:nose resistant to fluoxetine protein 6-like [Aricia agestis]|uniref:nose resistant to fluoxetine protein 6-like n=1 Tax=Aricia agestis TaxID=91739 RepID=UPI001C203868|nr:nose resistant to fluoxetine protein 6-like [Aricia agestis]
MIQAKQTRSTTPCPSCETDVEYYSLPQLYELDDYYGCLVRGGVYCFRLFQLEAPPGNELFHMIQVRQTRSTTPCPSCETDAEYYSLPQLYELDEYYGCLVRGGVYCFGLFQLEAPPGNELFHMIQHYSEDRVRHSDHSQLYRGFCLPRRCPHDPGKDDRQWFASCVNSTLISEYGVSAELKRLEYCTRELQGRTLTAKGVLFIGFVVVLAIAATITTILDLKLSDESKKDAGWMLSWSVLRSWRSLTQPVQTAGTDLRFLDGLRAISMMILMLLHATIYSILSVADTRIYEQSKLYMTMSNLTLAVQVFFIISSFLMAHKVLQKENIPAEINFVQTMQNRIVRILPTLTVWILYMSTLHEYFGSGPAWKWGVRNEVETCQQSWWMNVLFVNNFNNQVKCQKQTWYLAADMQLYVAMLALTLLLRGRRALPILSALLAAAMTLSAVIAYAWNLMPSYAIHSPDNYRGQYTDVATFNLLYQSPWGNAFASLTGLLLAHAHHALKISKRFSGLRSWQDRLSYSGS